MIHELEEVNKVLQFKSLKLIRKRMQTCNSCRRNSCLREQNGGNNKHNNDL